jgi:hypothetical protein
VNEDETQIKNDMVVPSEITLRIPLYLGKPPVKIIAKFRSKATQQGLELGFRWHRVEYQRQATFAEMARTVGTEADAPVIYSRSGVRKVQDGKTRYIYPSRFKTRCHCCVRARHACRSAQNDCWDRNFPGTISRHNHARASTCRQWTSAKAMVNTMRLNLIGLLKEKTAAGTIRWRVRVAQQKGNRITLNVTLDHKDFCEHYHAARQGHQLPPPIEAVDATIRGSIGWLITKHLADLEVKVESGQYKSLTLKKTHWPHE